MRYGYDILYFSYDANGVPQTVTHNTTLNQYTTVYQYVTNQQGDVIGIQDYNGNVYATYTYNAWGVPTSSSDSSSHMIEVLNPLRYRGYVYDQETGLYYLQSRYYNPRTGRFLNADGMIAGATGELMGYNQFAYCFNNPTNMSDSAGNWPKWAKKLVAAAAVVAVVAVVAAVTVVTASAGSVVAAAAVGAAKGAAIGFVTGAATGAATGYLSTGTLDGMLNGMADGALSGSISGAISGGVSDGVKAVAQSSSRVLWSGGDAAKDAAASYAKSISGTTLEQTPKGKLLTGLTNVCGYNKTQVFWEQASLEFASGAKGNVTAIVSESGFKGAGSVLCRVEYPMIASRILDGLADSFSVIMIG